MAFVRKCSRCGLELTDSSSAMCPICGTQVGTRTGRNIWIGAAIQFAMLSTFMVVFKFPKMMIFFFGGVILIGTALSARIKTAAATRPSRAPQNFAHPIAARIVGIGIAVCALAMFSIVLFGFVMFLDSWNRWHQYEGQSFHASEFLVKTVYFQKQNKGYSFYASGIVEGHKEWMSLQPYLHRTPRSQAEAETSVPTGTSIPIYFFPNMKGRARVQVYEDTPPAEAAHQMAIKTLRDSLLLLTISGAALFILTRIRAWCAGEEPGTQSRGMAVGR